MFFSDVMNGSTLWENFSFVTMVWSYIIKRNLVVNNNLRFEPGVFLEDFKFKVNTLYLAKRCVNTKTILYSYRYNTSSIMHNTSIDKQIKMLVFYIANAKYSATFLKKNGNTLSEGAQQVIKEKGDQMSLYGLMKAFKIDKVRFYFKELRKNDLYPLDWMKRPEYQMKKVKLFYRISQHENLTVFLSKLFKIYCKINPKAIQNYNW